MEIFNIPKWYIVYTRPLMEKKLAARFVQKNIIHYCPMKTWPPHNSKRQKSFPVPVFTSYVFVYVTPDKHRDIKKMGEVINLVHWLDKPVVIDNTEMDMLRRFLTLCNEVTIEKIPMSKNEMVTVRYNQLMIDQQNTQDMDNEFVKLQWHSIGLELKARVNQHVTTLASIRRDKYSQSPVTKFAI